MRGKRLEMASNQVGVGLKWDGLGPPTAHVIEKHLSRQQ